MKEYLNESVASQGDYLEAREFTKATIDEVAEYCMHNRHLTHQVNALSTANERQGKENSMLIKRNAELKALLSQAKKEIAMLVDNLNATRKQALKYQTQLQTTSVQELTARIAKIQYAQEAGIPITEIKL